MHTTLRYADKIVLAINSSLLGIYSASFIISCKTKTAEDSYEFYTLVYNSEIPLSYVLISGFTAIALENLGKMHLSKSCWLTYTEYFFTALFQFVALVSVTVLLPTMKAVADPQDRKGDGPGALARLRIGTILAISALFLLVVIRLATHAPGSRS